MSWRDAPLYVEAHDLARWLLERAATWEDGEPAHRVAGSACDLLEAVALALTFPARRAEHLEAADGAIVRLRCQLRLARELGLLSPGGQRFAAGRLLAIGRMVGGWRKRVDKTERQAQGRAPRPRRNPGDGPQAAAGA